ncbi:MAG: 4-hydroxythreonine-4-phosphate dehydrogenase PdxA [Gammaproteobacteria bacterium]|nr:4-hydroxythreonine-4-phosphate dehydrogenase PdxA [Gammaproteobacteria bacterium]
MRHNIAITSGEPAGIGPALCAHIPHLDNTQWHVIGDADLLARHTDSTRDDIQLIHTPLAAAVEAGKLNSANARYVLNTLDIASSGCLSGQFDAVVTAPVHKGVINDAGEVFTGHTEYFADRAKCDVVMMLACDSLRMTLATTHLPLRHVADALSVDLLCHKLRIIHTSLQAQFGIESPQIAVLGLNPHAGESGHMGREEIEIIQPAIDILREEGLQLSDPLPADTAFTQALRQRYHAYFSMFHDQGLPVVKFAGFGEVVNITLGLPYIRTSVDHGTALDKAVSGDFSPTSFVKAARIAAQLLANSSAT